MTICDIHSFVFKSVTRAKPKTEHETYRSCQKDAAISLILNLGNLYEDEVVDRLQVTSLGNLAALECYCQRSRCRAGIGASRGKGADSSYRYQTKGEGKRRGCLHLQ